MRSLPEHLSADQEAPRESGDGTVSAASRAGFPRRDLLRLVAAGGAGVVLAPVVTTATAAAEGAGPQPRSGSGELVVWARTSSEKVMLDTQLPADNNPRISLAGARNGRESAQLILRTSAAPTDARVIVTPPRKRGATISPRNVSLFHQHYIEVTDPQNNKFPAGWYPDALLPLGHAVPVTPDGNTALWISVDIPDDQPAGEYAGEVIVISSEATTRIPLDIRVWDFSLNIENQAPTAFAIWYSRISDAHEVELDSPEYFALADKYYKFQLEHRLPSNNLPIPDTDDPQTFIELAEPYLSDRRVTAFNIPYFQTSQTTIDTEKVAQVVALLRDRDWLSRGYFYLGSLIDEPPHWKYPVVRALAQQLTDVAPDVPHVVTTRPATELAEDVYTWGFTVMNADPILFQWIRDRGDIAWWYTVSDTTHPYPSLHIDDSLLGARLISWMQHDFDIKGYLSWATTIFDKRLVNPDPDGNLYGPRDPWIDPMATPGTNGEGFLLYPGKQVGIDGPVGTNRLQAVRDGLEDLEYLGLFQDGMTQIASSLGISDTVSPRDILRTYFDALYTRVTDYVDDPALFTKVRREIGHDIETMTDDPPALAVFNTVADHDVQVTAYAPPGSQVTINGSSVAPVGETGAAEEFPATLDLAIGVHTVHFRIEHDGQQREFDRTISVLGPAPTLALQINDFETAADISRVHAVGGATAIQATEHATSGQHSLQVSYPANTGFSGISLNAATDIGIIDWSPYRAIALDIFHPEGLIDPLYASFFDTGGGAEKHLIYVGPGRTTKLLWIEDLRLVDSTRVKGLDIWRDRRDTPATVHIDNLRFLA